ILVGWKRSPPYDRLRKVPSWRWMDVRGPDGRRDRGRCGLVVVVAVVVAGDVGDVLRGSGGAVPAGCARARRRGRGRGAARVRSDGAGVRADQAQHDLAHRVPAVAGAAWGIGPVGAGCVSGGGRVGT